MGERGREGERRGREWEGSLLTQVYMTVNIFITSLLLQLLNQYLDMLNSSCLLVNNDSTYLAQDPVKLSILQSSLRILLGAIASDEQQVRLYYV